MCPAGQLGDKMTQTVMGHVYVAGYAGVGYGLEEDGVSIASITLTGAVDFMINLDPSNDGIFGATPWRTRRVLQLPSCDSQTSLLLSCSCRRWFRQRQQLLHILQEICLRLSHGPMGGPGVCQQATSSSLPLKFGPQATDKPLCHPQARASRTSSSCWRRRCPRRSGCWAWSTSTCQGC